MPGYSRLVPRLSRISCVILLGLSLSVAAPAQQQPRPAGARGDMVGWANEELASLQSGELTVWESGSGVRLGWATIQNALKADFPEMQVNFRVVEPEDFLADLATAKQNGALPDIVFVENWRQGGPLLVQQRVVEMMGQTRFRAGGWWFQMLGGAHQATATAFLRWLEDSPHWQLPHMLTEGMTVLDKQQVASAALLAVAAMVGGGAMDSVMDPDAAKLYRLSWGTACGTISRMSFPVTRFVFGMAGLPMPRLRPKRGPAAETWSAAEWSTPSWCCVSARMGGRSLLATPRVPLELAVSRARDLDELGLKNGRGFRAECARTGFAVRRRAPDAGPEGIYLLAPECAPTRSLRRGMALRDAQWRRDEL